MSSTIFKVLVILTFLKYTASYNKHLLSFSYGQSEFAKALYFALSQNDGNVLFSPTTIHMQLALLTQGTQGDIRHVLENLLGLSNEAARQAYIRKIQALQMTTEELHMCQSNMIFVKPKMYLNERFKFIATEYFYTDFAEINFANLKEATDSINRELSIKTNNQLTNLFEEEDIPKNNDMLVTSVISLHGKWKQMFNISETARRKFHYCGKQSVDTNMMHVNAQFKYKFADRIDSHILLLPLTKDVDFVLILPHDCKGLRRLEENVQYYDLTEVSDNLQTVNFDLWLPKFSTFNSHNLNRTLNDIGFHQLFVRPTLNGIAKKLINSTTIYHKALFEMNEEGVEVSARTNFDEESLSTENAMKFEANHPFIFMLTHGDKYNKIILFMGRYSMPDVN